ncbi:hypothetical protein Goshw_024247 [Gossypium schwendimanii]|uniref:DUF4283 domain-containing protein n=1 Tax=Gossypium schwendimanii TaxID=34291 RepID=A0A7J9LBP6_GOSSC|nr:hypothetical protein [Gossypium schwendimanii]
MADLWHSIGGICITELGEKRYLFQFFNEIDFVRVIAGIPWFFNNQLLILQTIFDGENLVVMELNYTEFWIQVHDLPPGSMNELMAKQFGNFCGKFIEYDSSFPTLGIQAFLRIRVRLDVTASLKRKKKVLFGKSMVVYARFKYEKLSLFCFICGRLAVRCRIIEKSRWLWAVDGTPHIIDNLASFKHGIPINEGKVLGRNFRGVAVNQNVNPNLIPLGSGQYCSNSRLNKGCDGGNDMMVADGAVYKPMDLVLNEEDDPIALLEGRSQTVKRLKNKLRAMNPRILFLMETKLSSKSMEIVRMKCGFENRIDVRAIGTKGGLSLGWKSNSLVQLKSFSLFHIDIEIHDNECSEVWRLTRFYGHLDERNRSVSCDLLHQLNHDQTIPWVVLGDFNEIANSFEKEGGRLCSDRQMRDFCEALDDCYLTDLRFTGRWFTWERGRFVSTNIRKLLDRGVATFSWVNLFPGYRLEHLSHSFSDYYPLLIDFMRVTRNNEDIFVKPFRFKAKWCLDSSFEEMIKRWWDENSRSVLGKLEELGHHLLRWSQSTSRKKNRMELEDK